MSHIAHNSYRAGEAVSQISLEPRVAKPAFVGKHLLERAHLRAHQLVRASPQVQFHLGFHPAHEIVTTCCVAFLTFKLPSGGRPGIERPHTLRPNTRNPTQPNPVPNSTILPDQRQCAQPQQRTVSLIFRRVPSQIDDSSEAHGEGNEDLNCHSGVSRRPKVSQCFRDSWTRLAPLSSAFSNLP